MIDSTKIIFYKKFEGTIRVDDYVEWAMHQINNGIENENLNIIISFNSMDNLFEVEDYFNKIYLQFCINEPTYDECLREYIKLLALEIENNEKAFEKIYMISDVLPKLTDFSDSSTSGFNDKYAEISALIDVIGEIKYCGESQNMSKEELFIRIEKVKNNIIENGI